MLWSNDLKKYEGFFEEHDIQKVERCLTAWRTFSDDTLGETSKIEVNGLSVYDLPDELKDWGIYFYEQREND